MAVLEKLPWGAQTDIAEPDCTQTMAPLPPVGVILGKLLSLYFSVFIYKIDIIKVHYRVVGIKTVLGI